MLNLRYTDVPDLEKYEQNIGADGSKIYIDEAKYITALNTFTAQLDSSAAACRNLIRLITLHKYYEINADSMYAALIDYAGLSERDFEVRTPDGTRRSLDRTKILTPIQNRLEENVHKAQEGIQLALQLIERYLEYTELKSLCNNARAKLKRFSQDTTEGWGPTLRTIDFHYTQRVTGRYYTKDDNIQGWNLNMVTSIAAPKDYFLVWCDFAQIDLRVAYQLYLKMAGSQDDKIYVQTEDKYEAIFTIMNNALEQTPDYALFQEYRQAYKRAVLSAIYNASENSLGKAINNRDLAHALKTYIDTNPRYKAFRDTLDRVMQFGIEINIVDYFGFKRNMPIASASHFYESYSAVAQGCNTPIQATSNSIVVHWINSVVDKFQSLGYNQDKFRPYLIRHDEGVFLVHIDVMKDLWHLQDFCKIAVDDWDILSMEPHMGFYYKEEEPELEQMYHDKCLANKDKFQPRSVTQPRSPDYTPLADVLYIYTFSMSTPVVYAEMMLHHHNAYIKTTEIFGEDSPQCQSQHYIVDEPTDDNALQILEKISKCDISPVQEKSRCYLEYQNNFVVYSHKLKKFRMLSSLEEAITIINKIGENSGKYLQIYNTTDEAISMFGDIYIKFLYEDQDKLVKILSCANKVEGWVSIDV